MSSPAASILLFLYPQAPCCTLLNGTSAELKGTADQTSHVCRVPIITSLSHGQQLATDEEVLSDKLLDRIRALQR